MPRFKLDENLPVDAAEVLRRVGFDTMTVFDQQMGGSSDGQLADICRREDRTLVSLDLDFADIRAYPPDEYRRIIVIRASSQTRRHILELIHRLIVPLTQEAIEGKLWIVDDTSIRIRGDD